MNNLQLKTQALHERLLNANLRQIQIRYDDSLDVSRGTSYAMANFRSAHDGETTMGCLYTRESVIDYQSDEKTFIRSIYLLQDDLDGACPSRSQCRIESGRSLSWSIHICQDNKGFFVDYQTDDYYFEVKILLNKQFMLLEDFLNMDKLTLYDLI